MWRLTLISSCAASDIRHFHIVTFDVKYLTFDIWHLTPDIWHLHIFTIDIFTIRHAITRRLRSPMLINSRAVPDIWHFHILTFDVKCFHIIPHFCILLHLLTHFLLLQTFSSRYLFIWLRYVGHNLLKLSNFFQGHPRSKVKVTFNSKLMVS